MVSGSREATGWQAASSTFQTTAARDASEFSGAGFDGALNQQGGRLTTEVAGTCEALGPATWKSRMSSNYTLHPPAGGGRPYWRGVEVAPGG